MTSKTSRNRNESKKAIERCGAKCVICGWHKQAPDGSPLVEGCHILDYSSDANYDKYTNIIALCPNHHTEFDNCCFYIDTEKRTVVSFSKDDEENGLVLDIEYIDKRCLAYRQSKVLDAWEKKFKSIQSSLKRQT